MIIHYILITLLMVIVLLLAMALYFLVRKSTYISDKEKEFMAFVIDMYIQYAEDLEIHSKEQHKKIVAELKKIKNKYLN